MLLNKDSHTLTVLMNNDPTRTTTLRTQFVTEATKRWREISKDIQSSIVKNDALGLKMRSTIGSVPLSHPLTNAPIPEKLYEFKTDSQKVQGFMDWLQLQMDKGILDVTTGTEKGVLGKVPWANKYIDSAYKRGMVRADAELKKQGVQVSQLPASEKAHDIEARFNQPFHADKVAQIYQRVYTDLKNVTDDMAAIMTHRLSEGLAEGRGPKQIAAILRRSIEKTGGDLTLKDPTTGRTRMSAVLRSRIIARTEVIRAHHVASINTYRQAGIEGVTIKAEWSTAGDDRVCPDCLDLEGQIFTLKEIEPLIPLHPQCRCIALPVVTKISVPKGVQSDSLLPDIPTQAPIPKLKIPKTTTPKAVPKTIETVIKIKTPEDIHAFDGWTWKKYTAPSGQKHNIFKSPAGKRFDSITSAKKQLISDHIKTPEDIDAIPGWTWKKHVSPSGIKKNIFISPEGKQYIGVPQVKKYLGTSLESTRKTAKAVETKATASKPSPATSIPRLIIKRKPINFPSDADLDQLTYVKDLGGTTGAKLVQDSKGRLFVKKTGKNAAHIRAEYAADKSYQALNINVPRVHLYETSNGPVKLAEYIDGQDLRTWLKKANPAQKAVIKKEASKNLHVDALLGNRDVVGLDTDNMLVDKAGQLWRIDNGSSFKFRAQGTIKEFDDYPTELWTLRDSKINKASNNIFGDEGIYTIAKNIDKVTDKKFDAFLEQVPDEFKKNVTARWKNMKSIATKALDMDYGKWIESYTDDLTKAMMNLRKAGLTKRWPKKLIREKDTPTLVLDEQGKSFDKLRSGTGAVASQLDDFSIEFTKAAKTINHHLDQGDLEFNKLTLQKAKKQASKIKTITDAEQKAHYKKIWDGMKDDVQKALNKIDNPKKGWKPKKIKNVTQYIPKGAVSKTTDNRSVIEWLQNYMDDNGGNINVSSDWMEAQSSSSWGQNAQAMKWFIKEHRTVSGDEYFWKQSQRSASSNYDDIVQRYGADVVNKSLTQYHAFIQEFLENVSFDYNDQTRRVLRLVRTEADDVISKTKRYGKNITVKRGANESVSIYRTVKIKGNAITVQAVPHDRITGSYFFERIGGKGGGSFYADRENEFSAVLGDLPFNHVKSITYRGGNNAAEWNLALDHVREES